MDSAAAKLQMPTKSDAIDLQKPTESTATSPESMALLAEEFRSILLSHTIPVKTEFGDRFSSPCSYSDSDNSWYSDVNFIQIEAAVDDLRRIAGRMIAAGYSNECAEAYSTAWKTVLHETFTKPGIEKLSSNTIHRLEWSALELIIRYWIQAAKLAVRVLFPEARRLSEQVFKDLGADIDVDACSTEAIKDFAVNLFNFAEVISSSRKSPEKLFRILDLHRVLSDLLPDIQVIFTSKSSEFIRKQGVELLSSLSEAVRETLSEFEKDLLGESTKVPIPGGSVHPLSRYAMNYLHEMTDYKQQLEELILSNPSIIPSPNNLDVEVSEFQNQAPSPFVLHLLWIIDTLKLNLAGKSKAYDDSALAHLFVMNNIHHIVEKIKGSSILAEILGSVHLNNLYDEYSLAAFNYQKITWDKALDFLREDGMQNAGSFLSGVFKRGPRQRLKAFNGKFKKVLKTQATWVVPDSELRDELRSSIVEVLVPVYTSFLEKYRKQIESRKRPENCIKYSTEDIEKAVKKLFDG